MKKVMDFMKQHHMIEKNDRVIAGVSGGADSICLLFMLKKFQEIISFRLEVVHVEHGIRGEESLEDARFTQELCSRLNIPCHIKAYDVPRIAKREKLTIEEAARKCRYQAFDEISRQIPKSKIAVAHNQDDQAETILWNLIRGSGLKGLGGMQPVNGNIIRPLLCVSREEIEAWLQKLSQSYRMDSSNLEDTYTRNKLRHQIFPLLERELNGQAKIHIADAGERLRKADAFLDTLAKEKAFAVSETKNGEIWIKRALFLKEEEILQEYMLRVWIGELGVGLKDVSSIHLQELKKLAAGMSGHMISLPSGRTAKCTQGYLVLSMEMEEEQRPKLVALQIPGETVWGNYRVTVCVENNKNERIPQKKYTKWFDYDRIVNTIYLRSRCSGDYFVIDGNGSRKKIKKYFIDEKVLKEERDHILLLADGAHILWVAGYRISQEYKVTDHTTRILKVQIKEETNGT